MAKTIPAGWQEKTLGEVCTFLNGFAFESKKLKNIKDKNNNIPVIKIGNLKPNETVSLKESQYAHYDNSLSNFLIKKNDILFAMSGATVGKVSLFLSEEKALLNQRVGLIRLNEERISLKFLLYQLFDKNFYNYCQITSGGAAQPNISLKSAAYYQIKYPSLPEQERIVAKLDKAFEAIDKAKAIAENNLKNAKELFESSLNKAFTENTNDWEEKTLVELCNIEIGKTPSRSNIKFWDKTRSTNNTWLSIADLNNAQNKKVFSSKEQISDLATQYMKLVKEGTLLLSFKLTIGRVAFAGKDLYTNEAIAQLPIKNEQKIDKHYLYYYLQYFDYEKLLKGDVKVKGKTLNKEKLKALHVCYPPLPEQQKIVKKLDALHEQTKQLEQIYTQKIKNCDELKQSILKRAFRGEL